MMLCARPRFLLFAALLLRPAPAIAQAGSHPTDPQATLPIAVGARVRAWVPAVGRPDGWLVGTAVAVRRDAVEIRELRSGESWSVPTHGARLQVSRGRETARYSAAAGAVGGFLLGELAGLVLIRPTGGHSANLGTRTFELLRTPSVLLVGAAGAAGGFLLGRRIRGERWETVVAPEP